MHRRITQGRIVDQAVLSALEAMVDRTHGEAIPLRHEAGVMPAALQVVVDQPPAECGLEYPFHDQDGGIVDAALGGLVARKVPQAGGNRSEVGLAFDEVEHLQQAVVAVQHQDPGRYRIVRSGDQPISPHSSTQP